MARFNEILVGRFNRGLQKLFGIKGGPPSAQLATEIGVQHQFFNGAENRYLEGWNRFARELLIPASVGNNSAWQIGNPKGSAVAGVIEKLTIEDSLAGATLLLYMITTNIPALTTQNAAQRLDARISAQGANLVLSTQNAAGVTGVPIWGVEPTANTVYDVISNENQEITVFPGDALRIIGQNNSDLVVSCFWRERPLEDSEVT